MMKPILHHYPLSPFAEKIRRMLAYCEQPYQSVETSPMLPRRDLDQLTGGYRRIPVMQWGADIYCDTRAISERIAGDCGRPELAPSKQTEEQTAFIEKVDGELFFAIVGVAFAGKLKDKARKEFGILGLLRFAWDRMKLMKGAKSQLPKGAEARAMVQTHLSDLEARLKNGPYLWGETPTLADFSAYHSAWFLFVAGEHPGLEAYPELQAWMQRMATLGGEDIVTISAADSLSQAYAAQPDLGVNVGGEQATVIPDDYGLLPVQGRLVATEADEYVLERDSQKAGCVHVHFPHKGFVCRS